MSFLNDLHECEDLEKQFEEILKDCLDFQFTHRPPGMFPYFDILGYDSKGRVTTFEVKYERRWEETGNICFEYLAGKNNGAIFHSTADYIVYYLKNDQFYYCPTKELQSYLLRCDCKEVKGGDGWTQTLILVPRKNFKEIFTSIDFYK